MNKYNIAPTPMKTTNEKIAITPELIRLAGDLGRLAGLPRIEQKELPKLRPTMVKLVELPMPPDWPII